MAKRRYRFDIMAASGETIDSRERKCFTASAPGFASNLLEKEPHAAAVFAFEHGGRAAYAVYRA